MRNTPNSSQGPVSKGFVVFVFYSSIKVGNANYHSSQLVSCLSRTTTMNSKIPPLFIYSSCQLSFFQNLMFLRCLCFLLRGRFPLGLPGQIPPHEKLGKQIKITPIHQKRSDIVLLPNVTLSSQHWIVVIIKRDDRDTYPNEHLR